MSSDRRVIHVVFGNGKPPSWCDRNFVFVFLFWFALYILHFQGNWAFWTSMIIFCLTAPPLVWRMVTRD